MKLIRTSLCVLTALLALASCSGSLTDGAHVSLSIDGKALFRDISLARGSDDDKMLIVATIEGTVSETRTATVERDSEDEMLLEFSTIPMGDSVTAYVDVYWFSNDSIVYHTHTGSSEKTLLDGYENDIAVSLTNLERGSTFNDTPQITCSTIVYGGEEYKNYSCTLELFDNGAYIIKLSNVGIPSVSEGMWSGPEVRKDENGGKHLVIENGTVLTLTEYAYLPCWTEMNGNGYLNLLFTNVDEDPQQLQIALPRKPQTFTLLRDASGSLNSEIRFTSGNGATYRLLQQN